LSKRIDALTTKSLVSFLCDHLRDEHELEVEVGEVKALFKGRYCPLSGKQLDAAGRLLIFWGCADVRSQPTYHFVSASMTGSACERGWELISFTCLGFAEWVMERVETRRIPMQQRVVRHSRPRPIRRRPVRV